MPEDSEAQTLTSKGFDQKTGKTADIALCGVMPTADNVPKAICKKHPGVELRQQKDGRYYCPGCRKRLRKDEWILDV
ncbi:MAG: hypothetical protein F6K36_29410 [Symploca sp. SIO3C6]|nr:hypothetical protein [Symploca sp. SIO3C6]